MAVAHPTIPDTAPLLAAPIAGVKGVNAIIWEGALTANFVEGQIITTGRATYLACQIHYDADAQGTANQLELTAFVSNSDAAPAIGADEWVGYPGHDVTPTAATQADTFPSGVDMTATPEFGRFVIRPAYWQLHAVDNATDKLRPPLILDVSKWRHIVLLAKEAGDTDAGELGALTIYGALGF